MSLKLILGSSGSGKSTLLYNQIIEASMQSPEKNFLVIVPEQFTMQTQKELVELHPKKGLMNIDILSFQRLAHRIFEEVGADRRTVLEETGKTLLLRRAALKCENELNILKSNLHKQGYLQQMKSLISEMTQYDIDADKMERLLTSARAKPPLYYKLKDVQKLYEEFEEELAGKYITAEETLEALCQVIAQSAILKDSVIALDGFTGFTPIQQKLMRELMVLAEKIYVTVTIDAGQDFYRIYGEHELFYLSKKTIHALTELAKETGCELLPPRVLEWEVLPRFRKNPALGFLEAHLFRSGRRGGGVWKPSERDAEEMKEIHGRKNDNHAPDDRNSENGETQKAYGVRPGIYLHTDVNPIREVHYAARTIRSLVMDGYRYADIAVIVGDMASYANYIPKVFREYHVPCFLDSNRSVFSNPLIEFVRAALEMVQQDFSAVPVFRYLRAGLCKFTPAQLDLLENYVLAAGVRSFSKWDQPFTRKPERMTEEQFEICQKLRTKIVDPIRKFVKCMRSPQTNVKEKTQVLYELICFYEIQQQLANRAVVFEKAGQAELQKEYERIYAIVIELFDKMAELLGAEQMPLKEYAQILEAGFEEAKVGLIPPTADQVQVGDLERTRLKDIKVLFFLGLNDGWVPSASGGGGLISDLERETLAYSGVELAPTARENSYIQKFYLYLNLTKPQERLYLSYSQCSSDGAPMRPSYVLRSVTKLFPQILEDVPEESEMVCEKERLQYLRTFAEHVATPENGIAYLVKGLQNIREQQLSVEWLELYNWYRREGNCRAEVEALVHAAFLTFDEKGIGRRAAKKLYGDVLVNSVSRLETFASCAFAHFLQYGLQLKEREKYAFHPVDTGKIFHSVVENFSRQVQASEYNWFDLPDKVRDEMIENSVEEITRNYGQQILHDSARNEYMIARMKRIMRRTAWAVHQQIVSGNFYPANFEVSFTQAEDLESVNIALSEQEKMKLRGRIDRIDVCEKENQVYVKVIDYKSGNTSFDLVALYHGLQLQLVVYLNAAVELEKRIHPDRQIIPAGIFYYRMKDPLLNTEETLSAEEVNSRLLKELRLDGLVNDDPGVIREMDKQIQKASAVIPVTLNKDGSPSKISKTASNTQFAQLSKFVHEKMKEIGRSIMDGETAPVPYQRKQQSGCDYCVYQSICARDIKIPGTRSRKLKEYKAEELWEKMGYSMDLND
ncbi:MAG: PD-(D/E)XK nuclease family protein [Marvinbryantia sp.]|jgi:ATP-dependent helicase/nuclease subunit B